MSVKITFVGGTREVGRASVLVRGEEKSVLLDYGVALDHEPGFPMHVRPRDIDAITLTHAHLDHSGAVPTFFVSRFIPVYATPVTFEIARILIEDFLGLSGHCLPYEYIDLESMMTYGKRMPYATSQRIGDVTLRLLNAGHIPGSAQALLDMEGRRILYTGDFNTAKTRLLDVADRDYGEVDGLIIESTYADEDHPKRWELEEMFISSVREVVESGGRVLIPAFSVGRAQEILCILQAHRIEWPIALDGMARRVSNVLLRYPSYLRSGLLSDALKRVTVVKGRRDRRRVAKTAKIIVSPAGMLKGGPVLYYAKRLAMDDHNAIFLVSFQIPGTPGRILQETGRMLIDGEEKRVRARVEHFDFSSHCGREHLHGVLKGVEGNPKVFVVHGAEGNCEKLATWACDELGLDAVAPKAGETYEL